MQQSPYDVGRLGEQAVKDHLERLGATVELSPGSRTNTDVEAVFPNGTLWIIQVKASSTGDPSYPSATEKQALNSRATRIGAVPVYARVWLQRGQTGWDYRIEYYSARDDQLILTFP
jgi:hypothetical protein